MNAIINTNTGAIATISANPFSNPNDVIVGDGTGTNGLLRHTAGTLTTGSWLKIGHNGGTGIYNLSGTGTGGTYTGLSQGSGSITLANFASLRLGGDGSTTTGNGTLNIHTTGAISVSNADLRVGSQGTGTLNMDSGTINKTGSGNFYVGIGATGLMRMSGGTVNNSGELWVGNSSGGNGTLTLSGGAFNTNSWASIGRSGGTGVLNVSGGTLTKTNPDSSHFLVGDGAGATGTLNLTGGTINAQSELRIGDAATSNGTVTVSNGALNVNSWLAVGRSGGTGTLTISGGTVDQGITDSGSNLELTNFNAGGSGTVNLNGGTLTVNGVTHNGGGTGTSTFNFNGGTLRARKDNTSFLQGLTNARIRDGGAVIDTNGFAVTIGQNFFQSSSFGDLGTGILRKIGNGTLTLSGTLDNSGTRARVEVGTLVLSKTSSGTVHAVGSGGGSDYALQITGGTAKLGGSGGDQIYVNSAVNMTGGTFDLAGLSEGFDGLSGNGGTITNSTASTTSTLTLGQNNSAGSPVYSGTIQNGTGIVALVKSGTGTQTLSGGNSYSGGTTINAGTLAIGHNTALGSGNVAINDGGTLANNISALTLANGFTLSGTTNGATFTGSQNLTLNGSIGSAAAVKVTKTGASVLTLSADNSGTLQPNSNWNVTGGTYNSSTGLYNNVIAINMGQNLGNSSGNVLNLNGGTLRFNANGGAGYSSARTINVLAGGGSIDDGGFAFGEATGGGGVVAPNVTIANGSTVNLVSSNSLVLSGTLSGSGGAVSKFGTGTLRLSGVNSYTGGTTLTGGTLAVANDSALGTGTLNIGSGTTLANFNTSAHTLANNIVFSNASGATATISTTNDLTLNGSRSGGTSGIQITKTGAGTLTLPDAAQSVGSGAAPAIYTVTGGGTLALTRGNNLGTLPSVATAQVILDNGTLRTVTDSGNFFAERGMQINAAGGTWIDAGGNVNFDGAVLNNGPFTVNTPVTTANKVTQLNGAVSGSGSLSKTGAGTLKLAAANTYTGNTTVSVGTLNLTGSLGNTAMSVASGATFNPSQNTSHGTGAAGASLTLNSGAILDMTSASAGTVNTHTMNANSALSLTGANLRFDLGTSSADRLQVNSGTATVSGTNNLRVNTGAGLTPGTYTLIGSSAGGLTGNFQFDGGSTLTVPAQQQIKQVGGNYYRLTLQNSSTAEQVAVAAAPSNIIAVMPLGSSITEGVASGEGATYSGGGYRSQLYQSLVNDGRFTPDFIGSNTNLSAGSSATYNVLTGANELHHEGHSGYTTTQVLKNLNANGGDGGNNGGFWLAPGNGKNPDYVTLSIGGNDYGADSSQTTGPANRTDAIVSQIQSLRPNSHIVLSNLFYRTQTTGSFVVGDLQNTYYNPLVPVIVFNHVLAGHHVSFNDAYTAVTPGNDMTNIADGIHPNTAEYNVFANSWYDALANGSAYWNAGDGQWNNAANFAQNYQLTTPRNSALGASTDVHFNSNAAPLATTLGQDTSVRSVNFAAGATGAVTVSGNTLTLGAGGITVQAGTGAHSISSSIALGTNQTWGNVSSNPLTVSGVVSGSSALTVVGSYSIQLPGTLVGSTYTTTTQTVSGTGAIVLTAANIYTGATTISSGTLQLGDGGTTGSLSTSSAITNNGHFIINRSNAVTQGTDFSGSAIAGSGSLTKAGSGTLTLSAANTYAGNTTVIGGLLDVTGSLANNDAAHIFIAAPDSDLNGNPILTRSISALANGNSYADLGATELGGMGTVASLLHGTNTSGTDDAVSMQFRQQATGETRLISDVLNLTGMVNNISLDPHQTDLFVLQMSYDEGSLGLPEASLASNGGLYLAYFDGTQWTNAIHGNVGSTADIYLGDTPWSNSYTTLGQWGIDTDANTVWAVLNHNSLFAAVPEPGGIALTAMGLLSLLAGLRRRRATRRLKIA